MKLFVTGCYIKKRGGGFVLDTETGQVRRVIPGHIRGAIFHKGDLHLTRTNDYEVWEWNDGRPMPKYQEKLGGWEPHDVKIRDGWIYMNKTGTDQIVRRRADSTHPWEVVTTLRKGPKDTMHLNSLDFFPDGSFLCTSFAEDKGDREKWRDVGPEGRLLRIEATRPNEVSVIDKGLEHPHSARYFGSGIHYCDSRKQTVVSNGRRYKIEGYLRGLLVTEKRLWIGRSRVRFPTALGPGKKHPCAVLEFDPGIGRVLREFPIPTTEIYEIIEVPE